MHLLFRVDIFPGRSTMVYMLYPKSHRIHIPMNDLRTLLSVNFVCRYISKRWLDFTLPFNVISCCTKCFFYSERKSIPIDL